MKNGRKTNIIIAKGVSGIYKDKEIEVEIGENSQTTFIKVNGKKINSIFGVHIHMRTGEQTTLVLEKYKGDFE